MFVEMFFVYNPSNKSHPVVTWLHINLELFSYSHHSNLIIIYDSGDETKFLLPLIFIEDIIPVFLYKAIDVGSSHLQANRPIRLSHSHWRIGCCLCFLAQCHSHTHNKKGYEYYT